MPRFATPFRSRLSLCARVLEGAPPLVGQGGFLPSNATSLLTGAFGTQNEGEYK